MTEQGSPTPENIEQDQFIEPFTHSFILKLWLLQQEGTREKQNWRGHIIHVASNQRFYFDNFFELKNILIPYLEKIGVKMPLWWRVYRWLKR